MRSLNKKNERIDPTPNEVFCSVIRFVVGIWLLVFAISVLINLSI